MKRMDTLVLIWSLIAMIVFGTMGGSSASIDDSERNVLISNFPYTRGIDSDVELARILLIPQRTYHPKRNSELINSLLGLPKNMNNAGRK